MNEEELIRVIHDYEQLKEKASALVQRWTKAQKHWMCSASIDSSSTEKISFYIAGSHSMTVSASMPIHFLYNDEGLEEAAIVQKEVFDKARNDLHAQRTG